MPPGRENQFRSYKDFFFIKENLKYRKIEFLINKLDVSLDFTRFLHSDCVVNFLFIEFSFYSLILGSDVYVNQFLSHF